MSMPAGWYRDPEGREGLRYWDGMQWTEHRAAQTGAGPAQQASQGQVPAPSPEATPPEPVVQDGVPASDAAAAEAAGAQSAPSGGNWFTRHKILTGVGALVVMLLVIGMFGANADQAALTAQTQPNSPPSSTPSVSQSTPTSTPTPTPTTTTTPTPTPTPTPTHDHDHDTHADQAACVNRDSRAGERG